MIVAGFGFRQGAGEASLRDAYDRARDGRDAACLAAAFDKAASPGFTAFARALNLPVQAITPADLSAQHTQTRSPRVLAERGTGSVAEAAALAGAGPGARLLGPRIHSLDRMASCALAEGPDP
ncbi:cobalamin biosynthesis protein [Salipiger sp. H15]|uniref:Cobalamin biosynthesis protein n=2 Tax=Alloyangia sp. H15 TaxID=3029062 RepID=A0AAU8AQ36_9RHOB